MQPVKVKAHIEPTDVLSGGHDIQDFIGNHLADACAGAAAQIALEESDAARVVAAWEQRGYLVARRLATVEAWHWAQEPAARYAPPEPLEPWQPLDIYSATQQLRQEVEDHGHALRREGGKVVCGKCHKRRAPDNLKYWTTNRCNPVWRGEVTTSSGGKRPAAACALEASNGQQSGQPRHTQPPSSPSPHPTAAPRRDLRTDVLHLRAMRQQPHQQAPLQCKRRRLAEEDADGGTENSRRDVEADGRGERDDLGGAAADEPEPTVERSGEEMEGGVASQQSSAHSSAITISRGRSPSVDELRHSWLDAAEDQRRLQQPQSLAVSSIQWHGAHELPRTDPEWVVHEEGEYDVFGHGGNLDTDEEADVHRPAKRARGEEAETVAVRAAEGIQVQADPPMTPGEAAASTSVEIPAVGVANGDVNGSTHMHRRRITGKRPPPNAFPAVTEAAAAEAEQEGGSSISAVARRRAVLAQLAEKRRRVGHDREVRAAAWRAGDMGTVLEGTGIVVPVSREPPPFTVGSGHDLLLCGGFTGCIRCGMVVGWHGHARLAAPCRGACPSGSVRPIRRLARGLMPHWQQDGDGQNWPSGESTPTPYRVRLG